jgi:hypothetical protein
VVEKRDGVPTLLERFGSAPSLSRELIGEIGLQPRDGGWLIACRGGSGELVLAELVVPIADVERDVREVAGSGVFGGVVVAAAGAGWLLRLWSGSQTERDKWARRVARARASTVAQELLAVAGDARWAEWQRSSSMVRVRELIRAAVREGLPKAAVAELAGVSRQTVYDALDAQEPEDLGREASPASASRPAVQRPAQEVVVAAPSVAEPVQAPAADVVVALPRERTQPCAVCGMPAMDLVNGVALHLGECRAAFKRGDVPTRDTRRPALNGEPTRSAGESVPPTPEVVQAGTRKEQGTPGGPPAGPDFVAPAVALDGHRWYLPDGTSGPWEATHLGEVALLAQQLQLGWGRRGDGRFADEGQVWLYPGALERLGLPATLDLPDDLDEAAFKRVKTEMLMALNECPAVAAALEEGWVLGSGGHLDTWTKIWHPRLFRQGARLVSLPWNRVEGVALVQDEVETREGGLDFVDVPPPQLVQRLLEFARLVGISYRISPPTTAMDLIDHHRPPRRSVGDPGGGARNRVSLIKDREAELPPLFRARGDSRFVAPEADYDWWRPWRTLNQAERAATFAVAFDRNAAYLAPWSSIELGVEGLRHDVGADAQWAGDELPAFYLIDRVEWPEWWLPSPVGRRAAFVEDGRVWVSVHTLRQLARGGVTPRVHEAYRWDVHARYLQGPAKAIASARLAASEQVLDTVKSLYKGAVGRFRKTLAPTEGIHLWRPDWAALIIAQNRTGIQHALRTVQAASGAIPIVVSRDTIIYALDDVHWPGEQRQLSAATGAWKFAGAAPLAEWGPTYLPETGGSWRYVPAMDEVMLTGGIPARDAPSPGVGSR